MIKTLLGSAEKTIHQNPFENKHIEKKTSASDKSSLNQELLRRQKQGQMFKARFNPRPC